MRKTVAVFLLLAVLAGGLLCAAADRLCEDLYQVEMPCRTLSGDPAAAAGLVADIEMDVDWRLFWHTRLTPQAAPETTFRYQRAAHGPDPFISQPTLDIGPYAQGGFGSEYGLALDGSDGWVTQSAGGMEALYAAIAARTPAGGSRSETVRLADALPYYPLAITLQLDADFWHNYYVADPDAPTDREYTSEQDLRVLLADWLQLPIDAADCPELTVTKDTEGRVVSVDLNSQSAPSLATVSAILPLNAQQQGSCLFAFSGDWALQHPSAMGWGVYCLPYSAGQDAPGSYAVYPQQLCCVLPLADGERVLAMAPSHEGDAALVVSRTLTDCRLTVLDTATRQPTYQLALPLAPSPDGNSGLPSCSIATGDGFAVIEADGQLAVVARGEKDDWQLAFCADLAAAEQAVAWQGWQRKAPQSLAWDGRRLALGCYLQDAQGELGVMLAVWEAGDLTWLGCYDTSLDCNRGAAGWVGTVEEAPPLAWGQTEG